MKFKDFLLLSEEGSSSDKGLLGFPLPYPRKPSDGRSFRNLGSVAGATPKGGAAVGGGAAPPQMMKKQMKKTMSKN